MYVNKLYVDAAFYRALPPLGRVKHPPKLAKPIKWQTVRPLHFGGVSLRSSISFSVNIHIYPWLEGEIMLAEDNVRSIIMTTEPSPPALWNTITHVRHCRKHTFCVCLLTAEALVRQCSRDNGGEWCVTFEMLVFPGFICNSRLSLSQSRHDN